ncbi:FxDxF family PEP-CTERM protein [Propionivibrio sp.]|uniref:FxDxF family PEP-CTERM protein n=1 Tax=Propionivibrio sp. TaxID=2212460 RepID=UPI0025ED74B2|nr:FxDxF family PEP-CTERM protein [Propionivibrio sp.]
MSTFPKNCKALLGCAAVAACVLSSLPAIAAPTFYSTGTHIDGGRDLDWLVSTGYGSFNTANFQQAYIWSHGSETWISDTNYAGNWGPQYQWFTFRQYFDLTGYDASNAQLKFYWGADDIPGAVGTIPVFSVNGNAFQGVGTATGYSIGNNLVTLTSQFVTGRNYIDFRVEGNYATNGMGLRVESFTAPVPEPESYAMLLAGLGLLGFMARRRKQ